MKIIITRKGRRAVFCQKKDINFLITIANEVSDSIIERVEGFKSNDFIMFTKPEDVDFLQKQDAIINYDDLINEKQPLEIAEELRVSINNIKEKIKEIDESSPIHSHLEKALFTSIYKLDSIMDFYNKEIVLPPLPNPEKFKYANETHSICGTYNDGILLLRRLDHENMTASDELDYTFISEAVSEFVFDNDSYLDKENFSYEVVPKWYNAFAIYITPWPVALDPNEDVIDTKPKSQLRLVFDKIKKRFNN